MKRWGPSGALPSEPNRFCRLSYLVDLGFFAEAGLVAVFYGFEKSLRGFHVDCPLLLMFCLSRTLSDWKH